MMTNIFILGIVLTFFPIDVIEKIDGILHHTLTHITVVPTQIYSIIAESIPEFTSTERSVYVTVWCVYTHS